MEGVREEWMERERERDRARERDREGVRCRRERRVRWRRMTVEKKKENDIYFLFVFHLPSKSLNREYEMNVLAEGDFDERVFLHPSASEEIGTPVAVPVHTSHHQSGLSQHTPPGHVQFGTPLLGRELLSTKDHKLTPASEATHSVTQLHLLLENCSAEPNEFIRKLCGSCMSDPLPHIESSVHKLSQTFLLKSPLVIYSTFVNDLAVNCKYEQFAYTCVYKKNWVARQQPTNISTFIMCTGIYECTL